MKPKVLLLMWLLMCFGLGQASAATIQVSTTEGSSAEYPFYISNKAATSYSLTPETYATTSATSYGKFAFYSVDGVDDAYYIYNIDDGQWVTYDNTSLSSGAGVITRVSDKSSANYWNIAADESNSAYYDIRPYDSDGTTVSDLSWNWFSGAGNNTARTMGFYGYTDANSGWLLTAVIFEASKRYTIQQTTSNYYMKFDPTTTGNNALTIESTPSSFQIVPSGESFYLYNTDATHYVARTGWNAMPDLSSYYLWTFEVEDATEGTYRIKDVTGSGYLATDATTESAFVYTDKASTHANGIFKITEVSTQDVTYTYTFNDNTLVSKTVTEGIGCSPSGYTPPAYVTTSGMPETIVSGTTAYTVSTTSSFSSIADGSSKYLMSVRSGGKYLTYDADQSSVVSLTTTAPSDDETNSKAAFIITGDWYNGYTIKNFITDQYITAPSTEPGSGESTALSSSDTNGYFDLVVNSSNYYFKLHGTTCDYLTDYGGNSNAILKFWNSTSNIGDAGSQFAFTAVTVPDYIYLVNIAGDPNGTATVTYGGTAYTNGGFIGTDSEITTSDLTVSSITGYTSIVAIEGNAINITYAATAVPSEPSDLATAPVYTIVGPTNSENTAQTGGSLYYNSSNSGYLANTKTYSVDYDATSTAQQFAFIQGYLGTYLYNIGGAKFVQGITSSSQSFPLVSSVSLGDSHVQFLASTNTTFNTAYPTVIQIGDRQVHLRYDLTGKCGVVSWDNIEGSNNSFQIVAVSTADLTDVYSSVESAELAYINTLLAGAGTVGYPKTTCSTYTALCTLRDNLTSSTADKANQESYLAIVDAYLSETDIVLPTDGALYSIQSVYNQYASNAYIYDAAGTFTVAGSASETTLQNLWVAEEQSDGVYYFHSAASYDTPYYLTAATGGLATSGYSLTLSTGTKIPYLAMYSSILNGGRYVVGGYASNAYQFGNAVTNGYYATAKTQYGTTWSTDFLLTEDTSYQLYTVTISGAPDGSSPTVTYGSTAYSSGSKFVAPSTLAASALTASTISDYSSEIAISGTNVTVTYTSTSAPTTATVTYVYKYGDTEWYTESNECTIGDAYPDLYPLPTGVKYTNIPLGTVSATETVEIACTLEDNYYITPSSDYSSATWFYMSIHDTDPYYLYYNNEDATKLSCASSPSNEDKYKWAFLGNPFTGYKIINKAAGSTMILTSTDPTLDTNTGGDTYPHLVTESEINTDNYNIYWDYLDSNAGFLLSRKGESVYCNYRSTLAYWTAAYDGGSRMYICPIETLSPLTSLASLVDVDGTAVSSSTKYRLVNRYTGNAISGSTAASSGNGNYYLTSATPASDDGQSWTITYNSGYQLQNASTSEYMTGSISAWNSSYGITSESSTNMYFYEASTEDGIQYYYLSPSSAISPSDATCRTFLNDAGYTYPYATDVNLRAQWYLEPITTVTYETGITSGSYYRIISNSYTTLSMADAGGSVVTVTTDEDSYGQIWQITGSNGSYNFQNLLTGQYIGTTPGVSAQWSTVESSSDAGSFYTGTSTSGDNTVFWFSTYNTTGNYSSALHSSASQGYQVVGWAGDADASKWLLQEVSITSEDLAAVSEIQSATSADYTSDLTTYFDDYACTSLKSTYASMTDDELISAMSSLPSYIQNMAVRVKNDTWNTNSTFNTYEKAFRIYEYEPYSEPSVWQTLLGFGPSGRAQQSTGITVQTGDLVQIYVDEDVADSDAHLYAELITGVSITGTQYELQKGYNTLYATVPGELFITYNISNTEKYIANYPNIKVHVEGGTCTGTWDLHRGHTNNDWSWMTSNMFDADYLHIKGNTTMLCCYTDRVRNASNLTEVMKIWDFVQDTQDYLMNGTNYDGRCKVMVVNRDITSGNPNWGGGSANYPGIYANGLLNLDNYKYLGTDGGELWVIEHEQGHGHQNPFNVSGSTESTNNSLAQIVNHLWGYRTSRGHAQAYLAQYSNLGYSWIDYMRAVNQSNTYGSDANGMAVWLSNHLWYQLWLYFHQNGDDDFFPRFIQAIRDRGGLSKTSNSTVSETNLAAYTGTVSATDGSYSDTPAAGHYLKDYMLAALAATDAADADLYEFFKAWGFFKYAEEIAVTGVTGDASPIFYIGDYGSYYVRMPSKDDSYDVACLENIKAYMQSKTTKIPNLLFINDTQTLLPISEDAECVKYNDEIVVGTTTVQWADGSASKGAAGGGLYDTSTTGIYTDYGTNDANELYYDLDASTYEVTINGSGAVGYKVYDASGEMVWISYGSPFTTNSTIAAGLSAGTYTLVASLGDGTELIISSSPAYDMVVYNGTQDDTQAYKTSGITADSYTSGTLNVYRESGNLVGDYDFVTGSGDAPNALATLNADNDSNLPSTLQNQTNMIYGWNGTTGTAYNIDITDKANFYAPGDFTAEDVQYARTNTGGLNTVCLPFAVTADEYSTVFGEDASVYVLQSLEGSSIQFVQTTDAIAAGTPVLVNNSSTTEWSFDATTSRSMTGTASSTTQGGGQIVGAFQKATLGTGYYKLNSAGTKFVNTTTTSTITPFRFYLSAAASGTRAFVLSFIDLDETVTTIGAVQTEDGSLQMKDIYDLQGRRVTQPQRGHIYIIGGKKIRY